MTTKQHELLIRVLSGKTGTVVRELNRQSQPEAKASTFSYFAQMQLSTAIQCYAVGMEHESLELLTKSDEWMTIALERAAKGETIELEHLHHFRLSVCRWLLGPPSLPFDLTRACQLLHASNAMKIADTRGNADMLDSVLANLVYAERYEDCVAKFEQEKAKDRRSKRQKRAAAEKDYFAGRISADEAAILQDDPIEAPMAYLIARERLQPTLTETEFRQRTELFLRVRIPYWFKYGRYDLFAMWSRIITQAEAGAPARAAVRAIADQYA